MPSLPSSLDEFGDSAGPGGGGREAVDFKQLFEAAAGQLVVVLPDAPRFTVVAASDAYLRAVLKSRDELTGRGLFEVFPEGPDPVHAETVRNIRGSFQTVLESRRRHRLPTQQYDLQEGAGKYFWNLVTAPLLSPDGSVQYLLHQVEDVTDRIRAEADLREREDHFRYTVELSTQIPWTADAQGELLDFSRKWLALTGLTREAAIRQGLAHVSHPDDQDRMAAAWAASLRAGQVYDVEHRVRLTDGSYRWMRSQAFPRLDAEGVVLRWYGTTEDIDERKRSERRDAFLVQLDDAVRSMNDPQEITEAAARLLVEHLEVNRCAYADVAEDEDNFELTGNYTQGEVSVVGRYRFEQFGAECGRHMRDGRAFIVEDTETDPRTEDGREAFRGIRVRAMIAVSILKQGQCVGAMAVHRSSPRVWKQDEVELVTLVANRCWESIERARASRALQQREQRYRFLAESIPQMVWTATPDGQLDYVNERVTRYFGTSSVTVMGEGWLQWVHPEDQARAAARWRESLESGEPYETTFRLVRESDRSWRWHLVRALALRGAEGGIAQWFGTCTDVEDQKQAEAHLQQQWHTFDTALSHTPDFTYIFDLQGRFTYANRALLSLWQKPLEAARGRTFEELNYSPELAKRLQERIRQVIATKESLRDQTPYTDVTGRTRHHEHIFVPILNPNGEVEGVAGSTRDVSEQKAMEQELAASRERLHQVFSQAPVAIVVLRGRDYVVELANPYYQALLHGRELVGRRFADITPELGPEVWEAFRQVFETGEAFIANEFHVPYDKDQDGVLEDHWFNVVYHPLREDDAVSGMVAVCSEVTTQVRAREELQRVNRELEEFAYVASHDLQEPLRMVNIYTQLLLRRYLGEDADAAQFAEMIKKGVRRMEALIEDLLTFSRTVHTDEILPGSADLSAALAEAEAILKERIAESGATIRAPRLPVVRGDTAQLSHVFQNLLSNALKYRKADIPPAIEVSAEAEGDRWIVMIRDNGIGFDPQYRERIFGLFKRLHKDEYPGTGLGLAICRRILERYGGRIWAEGRLGEGAAFYLSLPMAPR